MELTANCRRRVPTTLLRRSTRLRECLASLGPIFLVAAAVVGLGAGCGDATDAEVPEGASRATLGGSASNVPVDSEADRVMVRWGTARSGRVEQLYLRVKVEGSDGCPYGGRSGYAAGTSGTLRATTHRVLANDQLSEPIAETSFNPCGRQRGESIAIDLGVSAARGELLATVVANIDANPEVNFFSLNFLTRNAGDSGSSVSDVPFPGRDSRESVHVSSDAGATWDVADDLIVTYVARYADGAREGQPFYWSVPASGPVTMAFRPLSRTRTVTGVGAYTNGPGAADVALVVGGLVRARVRLGGAGALRASIPPVEVPAGQEVLLTTVAGPTGLGLRELRADAVWEELVGLGRDYPLALATQRRRAVALYPLPFP